MEVTLTIECFGEREEISLSGDEFTFGRGETADVRIDDPGLSRIHARMRLLDHRLWLFDEGSTNGTFAHGIRIPSDGLELDDDDVIELGNDTKILVCAEGEGAAHEAASTVPEPPSSKVRFPVRSALTAICVSCIVILGFIASSSRATTTPAASVPPAVDPEPPRPVSEPPQSVAPGPDTPVELPRVELQLPVSAPLTTGSHKRYRQMAEAEQREFVERQFQRVARMVGNRETACTEGALDTIKFYVDAYSHRAGNGQTRIWGEDLKTMYKRATHYAPLIIRAFNENHVPPAIGLYLPVIETEYRNIASENFAGAAGLFQFIGPTAEAYGVPRGERTNVEKMAPAAAHYMNDRLAEFGTDPVGVGLAIAGYNRSPDSVRRDLHDVVDPQDRERSFWTLVANKEKLDAYFQRENVAYVPRFFAAAIIGENPDAFGLDIRPLSTYTDASESASTEVE